MRSGTRTDLFQSATAPWISATLSRKRVQQNPGGVLDEKQPTARLLARRTSGTLRREVVGARLTCRISGGRRVPGRSRSGSERNP